MIPKNLSKIIQTLIIKTYKYEIKRENIHKINDMNNKLKYLNTSLINNIYKLLSNYTSIERSKINSIKGNILEPKFNLDKPDPIKYNNVVENIKSGLNTYKPRNELIPEKSNLTFDEMEEMEYNKKILEEQQKHELEKMRYTSLLNEGGSTNINEIYSDEEDGYENEYEDLNKNNTNNTNNTNKGNFITKKLIINSNQRDKNKYPYSHNFAIPIKCNNVYKIKLLSIEIPKTDYIINEYNNKLIIEEKNAINLDKKENKIIKTVEIDLGNYDIIELLGDISRKLNEQKKEKENYELTVNKKSNIITIKLKGEGIDYFTIKRESSILNILGFDENKEYSKKMEYNGEFPYSLNICNSVLLDCDELNRTDDINNNKFCLSRINMKNTEYGDYCIENIDEEIEIGILKENFYPNIEELTFKFKYYNGNMYNFRGRNCIMLFDIINCVQN